MGRNDDDLGLGALLGIGALIVGAVGLTIKASKAEAEETARRRAIPIAWSEDLNQEVFEFICRKAAKPIRRLKIISIDGLYVSCEVKASSGLSTWDFSADFYDYGKLSGTYYVGYIENKYSSIPGVFLRDVSEGIKEILYKNKAFSPFSSESTLGLNVDVIEQSFVKAGFTNIRKTPCEKRIWSIFTQKGTVCFIKVAGLSEFSNNQVFENNSLVEIGYFYK